MSRRKTGQAQVRSKDQAADKLRDNKAAYQTLKQQVDAMHE